MRMSTGALLPVFLSGEGPIRWRHFGGSSPDRSKERQLARRVSALEVALRRDRAAAFDATAQVGVRHEQNHTNKGVDADAADDGEGLRAYQLRGLPSGIRVRFLIREDDLSEAIEISGDDDAVVYCIRVDGACGDAREVVDAEAVLGSPTVPPRESVPPGTARNVRRNCAASLTDAHTENGCAEP